MRYMLDVEFHKDLIFGHYKSLCGCYILDLGWITLEIVDTVAHRCESCNKMYCEGNCLPKG